MLVAEALLEVALMMVGVTGANEVTVHNPVSPVPSVLPVNEILPFPH